MLDRLRGQSCEDLRFKHPFTRIISGPSGSGKSTFCIKLLQNLESSTENRFHGGILWCYRHSNAVPSVDVGRRIQFHERVPDNFANAGNPRRPLNEVYSKEVCNLLTKGSHHRNISVILITQNLLHQAKYCRDSSLNAKYIVLLKNTRDKNQFTSGASGVSTGQCSSLQGVS